MVLSTLRRYSILSYAVGYTIADNVFLAAATLYYHMIRILVLEASLEKSNDAYLGFAACSNVRVAKETHLQNFVFMPLASHLSVCLDI